MQKIFVIEDDENIRNLVKVALEGYGFSVDTFETAEAALLAFETEKPDLALFDIMLPGISGLEAIKKLRSKEEYKKLPIIVLTAKDKEYDKVIGLDGGADDYITKPFNILEVKARIKAIMRRTTPTVVKEENLSVIESGDVRLDTDSRRLYISEKEINLTSKEFDMLLLLVTNPNKVYSRDDLLNTIWGTDYPGDARTVDVHIRRLREKIEPNPSEPRYVHTKWGVGYYYQK